MPAVAGNAYTLAVGKQSAKGTPAASATFKHKVTAGSMNPRRDVFELAETDGSRQQGKSIVVGARVEGNPSFYVRPSDIGLWSYALLGANVDSGSTNFTHIATMANSGPYLTLWENFGAGVAITKYSDCRVTGAHFGGQAGQPLTAGFDLAGLTALFGTTDDAAAVITEDPLVYPQVTVTKGGSAPGTVEAWSLDIVNSGQLIQADKQLGPYDYVWGKLAVTGTMTILFENDADFRKFYTGTGAGTVFTSTLFTESLTILAQVNANLSVQFDIANVAYTEYPLQPNVDGSPIRVAMAFRAMPDNVTPGNYIKITTKNQTATY